MNLDQYDVNDFLTDESFYQSVKNPNGEEGLFWNAWLTDHPEKKESAAQARKILLSIQFKDRSFNKKEITQLWGNIKNQTIDAETNISKKEVNTVRLNPWKYIKVAAVILPFIIASVLFLFFRDNISNQNLVSQEHIEKFNPKGQKLTVFLSDGSRVKLNGESRISYEKPFNGQRRVVNLEGEAFFEVTPDKNRPFIVKTGDIETKVLGTSFNVKAYPLENKIGVAVKTGKVSVENVNKKPVNKQSKTIVLLPTEMATYDKDNNSVSVSNFDPKQVLSWSEGILYFNDATMDEFVSELERWYGIDIVVERKTLIKKGIVGEFKDQSLEEILIGTHEASEFAYKFENGKVIIY